jgi:urease accessory protein
MRRWAIPLLFVAAPAAAHSGTGLPGGFLPGFLHPLTGLDHLLAMVAVGLWGAFLGRPLIYALPVIFPMMMVAGAELGMLGAPMPPVELGVAVSVLGLGAAIAAGWRAPVWAACSLVGIFALFHGYAHGRELPSAADPLGYSAGFVLATGMLHLSGIALGEVRARGLGAGIALAGLWFLWGAL